MGFDNESDIEAAYRKFVKAFNTWFYRATGHAAFFFFVFEHSKRRGVHSHGMLHIPASQQRVFQAWFERYGRSIGNIAYSTRIWRLRLRRASEIHQMIRFSYLMKGVAPDTNVGVFAPDQGHVPAPISRMLKLTQGYRPSGQLSLKRIRFSRSVSPTFLSRQGFRTELDVRAGKGFETFYHFGHCSFVGESDEWMREEL